MSAAKPSPRLPEDCDMDTKRLIDAVLQNRVHHVLVERLPGLGLPDAWLAAGSLFQTVCNMLTGRAPDYGIRDYDIFYFDADTSWEAEDAVIRRVTALFSDTGVAVEARNQARVHLWYPAKFGVAYPPLQCSTDAIDRFLTVASQIGIRPAPGGHGGKQRDDFDVYAPHGLDDLWSLTVRPNRCANFLSHLYEAKAAAWKARWPELTILPAPPASGL
jgi:hypothetical protein